VRYKVVRLGDVCLRRRIAAWQYTNSHIIQLHANNLNGRQEPARRYVWHEARQWRALGYEPGCWGIIDMRDGME
jgi:hypothetical protein